MIKAYELGVLCQVDIAVLVWSHTGKLHVYVIELSTTADLAYRIPSHSFSSAGGLKPIMDRYASHGMANVDMTTPKSYGDTSALGLQSRNGGGAASASNNKGSRSKKRRRSDSDDDDDDDDEEDDGDDYAGAEPMGAPDMVSGLSSSMFV